MSNGRLPRTPQEEAPYSVGQAEQALIGSVLIDPTVLDRIAPIMSAADFADAALGALFAALGVLCEARLPITDFTWLPGELARMEVPEDVRTSFALLKCVKAAVHAGHAVYYGEQVARAAGVRRLSALAGQFVERAAEPSAEPNQVAEWLNGQLARLSHRQQSVARTIGAIASEVIAELDEQPRVTGPGVMSGLPTLDEALGPIMAGELCVIAARTGCGKTSLATQWAENVASKGRPVLLVSLEMRDAELVKRMLCGRAGIDSRDLRGGTLSRECRSGLADAVLALDALPLRLWSPASATVAEIRGVARHAKATGGLELLIVDYIGLVRPEDRRLPRYEQVSAISAGLKELAKELAVPLIALAQLNREADGQEPKLSHLRESGSIEQDADAVLLIHHPSQSGPAATADARAAYVIIAKHRHGETGRVSLLWRPRETRFDCPGRF